jgi:hypothetical protein
MTEQASTKGRAMPLFGDWRRLNRSPYRNYEISSDGRVRRNGRELVGQIDRYGYRTVLLSYAGLSKRFKVSRLVCEAFHGPAPEGHECAHLDGDSLNDRASNVAWVTRSENTCHQLLHGTFAGAANLKPGNVKYPPEIVSAIRADAEGGLTGRRIAAKYGVSPSQVYRLISGQQRVVAVPEPPAIAKGGVK